MFRNVCLALSLLFLVLLASCPITVDTDPGGYCFGQCTELHPDGLKYAEWQGDDRALGFTRCACFVDDGDGYGVFEYNHLVPLREYGQ